MKAFASPDRSPAAHQRKSAPTPPSRPATLSARTGYLAGLSRNACACGGGCPRCQGNLTLQAKLAIGLPGDPYEQEAERVADRVMRMPESTAGHQGDAPSSTDYQALVTPIIQPQTRSGSTLEVSSSLTADIESAKSGGQPLAHSVRDFFEPRFGRDFSTVRVHPDFQGSQDLKALAFTTGQDIFFGQGQYNPDTTAGQKLLAHELTHVVQQSGVTSGYLIQRQYDDEWGITYDECGEPQSSEQENWEEQSRDIGSEKKLVEQESEKPKVKESSSISPHPEVARAAEMIGDDKAIIDSYQRIEDSKSDWFFSYNGGSGGLRNNVSKPLSFVALEDWSRMNKFQQEAIANLAGFQRIPKVSEAGSQQLNSLTKLRQGYNKWPSTTFVVFWPAVTFTCNIFVGESLFLAGKTKMYSAGSSDPGEAEGTFKYYGAGAIYKGLHGFVKIKNSKIERGDIRADGEHVEVVTTVDRQKNHFKSRGTTRNNPGKESGWKQNLKYHPRRFLRVR